MLKFFVRTVEERTVNYDCLSYELLIDYEHKPIDSFITQLEYINSLQVDAVLLEDDLILCDNFEKYIEEAILSYPDTIINFYTWPEEYFLTRVGTHFQWNQCTYYPHKCLAPLITELKKQRLLNPTDPYDELEAKALRSLNMLFYEWRPCLVQHVGYRSFIIGANYSDTIYFKDYLDNLQISYDNASEVLQNKGSLEKLCDSTRLSYGVHILRSHKSSNLKAKLLGF